MECLTDIDARVRHQLFVILKCLLSQLSSTMLQPFFTQIVARLCCGLTHIEHDIRMDTLQVLDILLDHFPALVACNSKDLLPIIVDLISQQCNTFNDRGLSNPTSTQRVMSSDPGNLTKQPSRALTVRLKGKLNIHQIRQKVLYRLRRFLSSIYSESITSSDIQAKQQEQTNSKSNLKFNYHIYTQQAIIKSESSLDFSQIFILPQEFRHFIDSLMPLLMNIWLECNPSKLMHNATDGDKLLEVSISLMKEVLSVLQLLCQASRVQFTMAMKNFDIGLGKYFKNIQQNVFLHFPLTAVDVRKGKKYYITYLFV